MSDSMHRRRMLEGAAKFELEYWKASVEHKDKKWMAFQIIKNFASLNMVIPDVLMPYLNEACESYINDPGIMVTKARTKHKWAMRVFDAEVLRRSSGYTVIQACEAITRRDGYAYSYDSLFAKRKGHSSKNVALIDSYIESLSDDGYTLSEIENHILSK